jgi:hypothetical protein
MASELSKRDHKRLTRTAIISLIRNWQMDGCPMANGMSGDFDEAFRIIEKLQKQNFPNSKIRSEK